MKPALRGYVRICHVVFVGFQRDISGVNKILENLTLPFQIPLRFLSFESIFQNSFCQSILSRFKLSSLVDGSVYLLLFFPFGWS